VDEGSAGDAGRQRRRQVKCLMLVECATAPDDGTVSWAAASRWATFAQHAMDLLDGERTVFESPGRRVPQAGRAAAHDRRCFGFSGDEVEKKCGCCRAAKRHGWSWRRCSTTRRIAWGGTSPTQPPRHGHQGDAGSGAVDNTERPPCCSSPTTCASWRAVNPRAGVTPEGIHIYGGAIRSTWRVQDKEGLVAALRRTPEKRGVVVRAGREAR